MTTYATLRPGPHDSRHVTIVTANGGAPIHEGTIPPRADVFAYLASLGWEPEGEATQQASGATWTRVRRIESVPLSASVNDTTTTTPELDGLAVLIDAGALVAFVLDAAAMLANASAVDPNTPVLAESYVVSMARARGILPDPRRLTPPQPVA